MIQTRPKQVCVNLEKYKDLNANLVIQTRPKQA